MKRTPCSYVTIPQFDFSQDMDDDFDLWEPLDSDDDDIIVGAIHLDDI